MWGMDEGMTGHGRARWIAVGARWRGPPQQRSKALPVADRAAGAAAWAGGAGSRPGAATPGRVGCGGRLTGGCVHLQTLRATWIDGAVAE